MSSSYIVEPEESQSKKDDTLIIVVNDDGTIAVDQETLQNLIMNQSNANVSVVRVGQGDGDSESGGLTLTVDPPTFATTTPIGTLSGSSTDPNILVDPFMEMDKEQLERLEIALQSEQAKQILGENVTAMLDMLSVEEQQNNLRYVVGLDHCYTKKYPAEPAPVEVLPDTGTTQIEEMPFLQGVATSQSTLTATTTSGHENSTSAGKAKAIVTRPTKTATRTRKSTVTGPTATSPAARKSTENEEDEEDSFTESESSESEPTSDDDSDFGPRPRRGGGGSGGGGGGGGGGVRARGGRKGIATRGGSLSATRRRGLNKQMDSEQVRRLDMEMAAAVHAMKSPEKEEKTERFSPGKPKKPVKTFVGKKKDEPQQQHQVLPEAETREKLPQTTNRVKANLVSANMFQGDMILTKPGQARSNNAQKMTFLQKQQQQQQHLATKAAPGDARTSQVPDKPPATPGTDPKPPGCAKNTIPGATSSVATTPIGQKTLPVASPSPEKQQGAVPGKARALEVKREKRKSDASLEPTVKSDVETKTHESATKKHAKKEHRKPPAYATEGPALFSTPDIIRRVGSVGESKAPELTSTSPTPTMNTAAAVVAPSTTTSTTTSATTSSSTDPPSELTTLPPGNHPATAAVAAIAPPPGINEDPTKIELNLSTTSALDSGSLPRHLSEDISEDQKDMKPPLAEELQPSLDPESKTDSSERVTVPAEQTIVPNHIDSEQSGIEGEEHLLATLEMEASKHEEELLAEALLLQEELGVDLADHPALDEQPSEPLLQPTPFLSPIIPPEDALKQQQPEITTSSSSVPDPVLPPNTTSTTTTSTTTPETSRAQPLPPVTAAATPGVAVPVPAASVVPGTPGISRLEESKKGKDKEPIQIVRGGRVITLPPIEAPATRSKRLQAKQEISTPAMTTTTTTTTGTTPLRSSVGEKRHDRAQKQQTSHQQKKDEKRVEFSGSIDDDEDDEEEGENSDSEDDPDRLWCICKQPHNNRFMICCDVCEDWFHGKCVHVSKAMGQQMEEQGMEWVCPNCRKKTDDSRMTPSTSKHQTKAAAAESLQNFASKSAAGPSTSTSTSPLVVPEKAIPTSVSTSQLPVTQCVVCKREARSSSIYCSDACILAHAQETLTKESKPEVQQKTAMATTTTTTPTPTMTKLLPDGAKAKAESRVIVFDKTTGTVLAGAAAPTTSNLKTWLREHPTYEVVRPNNLNTFQLGGKTVTAIPTQVNKANKSVPHGIIKLHQHQQQHQQQQQQQSQPKMIYTKVAGSKQTILAPSTKKITIISTGNQGPALQTKTVHVKSLGAQQTPSASHQTLAKKGPSLGPKTTITTQQRPPGGGGVIATKKPPDVKSSPSAAATSSFPGSASSSSSSSAKVQTKLPVTKKVAEPEPIRLNVRKTLAELLTGRIKATEDLKLTDTEIGDLALNIELELYKFFKDTGAKYKAKYRSLVFNIKDTKNLTLFRKIADRSLTPDAVVKLSPEEMASQELAEWREKETKHQLEMIKKNELDLMAQAKSIVVKTHKGEQIIENDGVIDDRVDPKTPVQDIVSALNDPEVTGGTATTVVPEDKWEKKPKLEETRKRDKDERRNRDRDSRSHSRNRHRDRDKDREHGKSKESRRSSSTRSKESRRDKEKERDRAKVRDKDRPKEKHKRNKSRKESHRDKERKEEAEDLVPRKDIIIGGVEKKKWGIAEGQKSSEEGKNAVDGNDSDVSDREPSSTVTIKTPDINEDIDREKDSEIEKEIVQVFNKNAGQQLVQPVQQVAQLVQKTVWRGFVSMIDVAKFFITAQEISGNARDLMEDLPDTIDVVGRITYDIVWDYIAKMKKNNSKEILVIRLTAANDEEKIPYITFYSYLHSRSRMGVIGNVSKNIKDFYIMPFPNTSPVPQVLLPLNGPVFEENRPHLLLGIIVRIKRKRPSNLPPSTSSSNVIPAKIAKKDNADRSYTPPLVSSNPHKEKPSGQELLKQLPFDVFPEKKSEPKVVLGRGTVDAAAVISKIVPELSSKIDLVTSSPQGRLEDEEEEEDDEEEHRRQQGTTSSVSEKKVDDDDEPYSPSGAIDDDDEDDGDNNVVLESAGSNNNNLLTVESSTTIETTMQTVSSVSVDLVSSNPLDDSSNSELQRNLDELNRRIEEQKQEIQNMIGDSTSTLPGLTLDPVTMADGDEAYSPSDTRSFTPPPISKLAQPLLDTVSSITIPPNLQEILANVKRQESTQQKVDPYLPSKPSASFLTSTFYSKPEKYTPSAFSKRNHHPVVVSVGTGDCGTSGTGSTGVATEPKETSKSTLRELSDQDLIKKAEEELAAVAAAAMLPVAQSNAATSPGGGGGGGGQTHPKESVFHPSPPKKPPGVDDHEEYVPPLPPLPPPPPAAGSGQKFVPKSGIVMSVKRKLGEDSSSSASSSSSSSSSTSSSCSSPKQQITKITRTKSRWGQGPPE